MVQLKGVAFAAVFALVMSLVILYALKLVFGGLRVAAEDEEIGLDLSQHSETAYSLGTGSSFAERVHAGEGALAGSRRGPAQAGLEEREPGRALPPSPAFRPPLSRARTASTPVCIPFGPVCPFRASVARLRAAAPSPRPLREHPRRPARSRLALPWRGNC